MFEKLQAFGRTFFLGVIFSFAGLVFAGPGSAGDFPAPSKTTAYSDMALLDKEDMGLKATYKFLVVHDLKNHQPGPRLGLLETNALKATGYEAITIDWGSGRLPNDLETACTISKLSITEGGDKTIEVLVAESGNFIPFVPKMKLYHLRVNISKNTAKLVKAFVVPALKDNSDTAFGDQYEGILCKRLGAKNALVVLGERGGSLAHPTGFLRWFNLDLSGATPIAGFSGQQKIEAPTNFKHQVNRYIGGLTFCGEMVWAAATYDPDIDDGPFNSAVYQVGRFDPNKKDGFNLKIEPPVWITPGHKLEGIYAFPEDAEGNCRFAGVTDDENHGGVYVQQLKKFH